MIEYGGNKKASQSSETGLSLSEIVGQEQLKRALLAVAANGELDGLLIRGEKGTAKSTAVRALTDLLPDQTVVEDCPYGCPPDDPRNQCADCRDRESPPTATRPVPLVTLPLGATRERVLGTLSVADALAGDYEFDPGLLARANRGILYVDEVNLLDDHLVDVLLDVAAGGVNRVERDGVSVTHPSRITLVGTMNPEEGELRPQLRDRFALQATVTACEDLERRVEIIDRALGTSEGGAPAEEATGEDRLRDRLSRARALLGDVELPAGSAREIARLCREAGVEGHRGDIATARAARTFAALDGRRTVIRSDIRAAAELAVPHRLRSRPFEDAPDPDDLLDDHFDDEDGETGGDEQGDGGREDSTEPDPKRQDSSPGDRAPQNGEADDAEGPDPPGEPDPGGDPRPCDRPDGSEDRANEAGASPEPADSDADAAGDDRSEGHPIVPGQARSEPGETAAPELSAPEAADGRRDGTRSPVRGADSEGPRVQSRPTRNGRIDAAASVRAAAARGASSVESRDLRQSVRQGEAAALVVFAVDASASMRPAMRAAKGTVLELLKDAYQQRDEVAFVTFAGEGADVLLPPTDSPTHAARHLKELPTGDRTPLPDGLETAGEVIERADPDAAVAVVVTDGRANVAESSPVRETRAAANRLAALGARVVVVDAGDDGAGLTDLIARETDGEAVPLSALSPRRVEAAVGAARENDI